MIQNQVSDYLSNHSPLTIPADYSLLDPIIRDLFLEQDYTIGEAISKGLVLTGLPPTFKAIGQKICGHVVTPEDHQEYKTGFFSLISLIQHGYIAIVVGTDNLRNSLKQQTNHRQLYDFLGDNLIVAASMIGADNRAMELAEMITRSEVNNPSKNLFYRIGVQAAHDIYVKYVRTTETLVSQETLLTLHHPDLCDIAPLFTEKFTSLTQGAVNKQGSGSHDSLSPHREISPTINYFAFFKAKEKKIEGAVPDFLELFEMLWRAKSHKGSADDVLLLWDRLINIDSIKLERKALWSSINIAAGEFAEAQFKSTGDQLFAQKAMDHYERPLSVYSATGNDPGTRYMCCLLLLRLLSNPNVILPLSHNDRLQRIHGSAFEAIRINEKFYKYAAFNESLSIFLARIRPITEQFIRTAVYVEQVESKESRDWSKEAIIVAENGKSREVRSEMSLTERAVPSIVPENLANKEMKILEILRTLTNSRKIRNTPRYDSSDDTQKHLRNNLESIWSQMEVYGTDAREYVKFRRDELIYSANEYWENIEKLLGHLGTNFGIASLFLLSDKLFVGWLSGKMDHPETRLLNLSREQLSRFEFNYRNGLLRRPRDTMLEKEWARFGNLLLDPLGELFASVDNICFIPHNIFHSVPIHALNFQGSPLIDSHNVFYAPSISVLETTLYRKKNAGKLPLVMGYDSVITDRNSPIVSEAELIASGLGVKAMINQNASRDNFINFAPRANIIHLSCHGKYGGKDPLESGVELFDGHLTAYDWLRLPGLSAELVTLSSCESGLMGLTAGDNPAGLSRSVLVSGASSLLTAFWSVDAKTTAEWMQRFYNNVWDNNGTQLTDKLSAFRKVTLEVRKTNPSLYYWAPFALIGNPF